MDNEKTSTTDTMKYNGGTYLAGMAAAGRLSKKAAKYYNNHTVSVFEYETENGEKRYAYPLENNEGSQKTEDLTFEELQAFLEKMQSVEEAQPEYFLTGDYIRTPRGSFSLTGMSVEQMREAGYGLHHESEDGNYYIMGNGTQAFAVMAHQPEKQPEPDKPIALLTVKQNGFVKYFNMGEKSMDEVFSELKHTASPFMGIKGEAIADEGRFAALEQSGKVSVSVTADIDNDVLTVYEINGIPEEKRTDGNTRIWNRPKMSSFLKDRVREPKSGTEQHSPFRGVGRSHASEHELEM